MFLSSEEIHISSEEIPLQTQTISFFHLPPSSQLVHENLQCDSDIYKYRFNTRGTGSPEKQQAPSEGGAI